MRISKRAQGLYNRPDHLQIVDLLENTYRAVSAERSRQQSIEEQASYIDYLRILEFKIRQTLIPKRVHNGDSNLPLITE